MRSRRARPALLAGALAIAVAVAVGVPLLRATTSGDGRGSSPSPTEEPIANPTVKPAPSVPSAGRVGLSSHLFWQPAADIESDLRTVVDGGVRWIREDLTWAVLEPDRGRWDWTKADRLMRAASHAGVSVLGILDYSAPWASSGEHDEYNYPPKAFADFATYAANVAARYGSGGVFWAEHPGLVPAAIALEIWNEPFAYWSWEPAPNPIAYAAMVRAGATAIRAANAAVQILISGDVVEYGRRGPGGPWLDRVLAADVGLGSLIDAFSVHPYPSPRQKSPLDESAELRFDRVPETRAVAMAHGLDKPVWITEIGWTTATRSGEGVNESTQARFIGEAIERALTQWTYVAKVFVYTWDTSNGVMTDTEGNFALRRANGTMKPAWQVVKDEAARWRS